MVGKKFEPIADSTEKWYGTAYKLEKIDAQLLETWEKAGLSDKLHLPPKNEFIPDHLELVPREEVSEFIKNLRVQFFFKKNVVVVAANCPAHNVTRHEIEPRLVQARHRVPATQDGVLCGNV